MPDISMVKVPEFWPHAATCLFITLEAVRCLEICHPATISGCKGIARDSAVTKQAFGYLNLIVFVPSPLVITPKLLTPSSYEPVATNTVGARMA